MNIEVRNVLIQELFNKPELIDDPDTCYSILMSRCPRSKLECFVLKLAQENRIPQRLSKKALESEANMFVEFQLQVSRLKLEFGLSHESALWALESWAQALQIGGYDQYENPTIHKYYISNEPVLKENYLRLRWEVTGLEPTMVITKQVSDESGASREVDSYDVSGSTYVDVEISPHSSFTLTASNTYGTATHTLLLPFLPVEIEKFNADKSVVCHGQTTSLSWVVHNATRVELRPLFEDVEPVGSMPTRMLTEDTAFELVAYGERNLVQRARIIVKVARIYQFGVQHPVSPKNENPVLGWIVAHAEKVYLDGAGDVTDLNRYTVDSRFEDTTYVLRATTTHGDELKETLHVEACEIIEFSVDKKMAFEGESIILSWKVRGARFVHLSGVGHVSAVDSKKITATPQSTDYTLTAFGDINSDKQIRQTLVVKTPEIKPFLNTVKLPDTPEAFAKPKKKTLINLIATMLKRNKLQIPSPVKYTDQMPEGLKPQQWSALFDKLIRK